MRAFIAIELPDHIKAALGNVQGEVVPVLPPAKWAKPQNLHLTMIFLGDINATQAEDARAAIAQCAIQTKKIQTKLTGFGYFPSEKNPRVFFTQLEHEEEFIRLHQALCAKLKIMPEKRFRAHITLCRFKKGEKANLMNKLPVLVKNETFTANRLTLFESTLTPDGPIYEKIFSEEII
jgi:2'-5' RNA ligase